ncbi:MAG: hypothetical protein IKV43_06355 [Clostridia bacterium]|nr:hypothetical protein [Clostridia bacterium]
MASIKDNKEYEKKNYIRDKEVDPIDGRYSDLTMQDAVPGINTPGVTLAGINEIGINPSGLALPAFNPPVPNRAWTAMRAGLDIDQLTEEEKRELYYGHDPID